MSINRSILPRTCEKCGSSNIHRLGWFNLKAFKAGRPSPPDAPFAYYCENENCKYESPAYRRWKRYDRARLLQERREFKVGLEMADSSATQRKKAKEIISSLEWMLEVYHQVRILQPQMPTFEDPLRQIICLYLWQNGKASDRDVWMWVDSLGIPLKDNLTLDSKRTTYVLCYLSKNKQLKHRLENITNPIRRAIRDAREAQNLERTRSAS